MNAILSFFRKKGLITAVLAYLALPNIVFFMGWLNPWVAASLILLLVIACLLTIRKAEPRKPEETSPTSTCALIAALLLAAIWVFLIGITGQTPQTWDFVARNPIYETLVRCDWPIFSQQGEYFIYYHAFMLPPALMAKCWAGFSTAAHPSWFIILSLWAYLGIALAILLLHRRFGTRVLVFLLIFLFIGSLGESFNHIVDYAAALFPQSGLRAIAYNSHYALSVGCTSQLFNTFHHAIPTWLTLSTILEGRLNRGSILFTSSLLVLTSPMGAIGLLILLTFLCLDAHKTDSRTWKAWLLSPETAIGCMICACVGLYYMGGQTPISCALLETPYTAQLAPTRSIRLLSLAFHISMPVLMAVVLLGRQGFRSPAGKTIYILLIVCPLIYVGYLYNELLFKISAVTFFLFTYLLAKEWTRASWAKSLLIITFVLASSYGQSSLLKKAVRNLEFSQEATQRHCQAELQGHLNHPEKWYYRHFFGNIPPLFYLRESGSSAQGLMGWCATHNRADTEPLPPIYYPQCLKPAPNGQD